LPLLIEGSLRSEFRRSLAFGSLRCQREFLSFALGLIECLPCLAFSTMGTVRAARS